MRAGEIKNNNYLKICVYVCGSCRYRRADGRTDGRTGADIFPILYRRQILTYKYGPRAGTVNNNFL